MAETSDMESHKMKKDREDSAANTTKRKLSGLPFSSATEMRKEEDEIVRKAWRDMTRSKVILELAKRDEFAFFNEIFKQGVSCKLRDGTELMRVSLRADGLEVELNHHVAIGSAQIASNMTSLIQGISDTLLRGYLESIGVIRSPLKKKKIRTGKPSRES